MLTANAVPSTFTYVREETPLSCRAKRLKRRRALAQLENQQDVPGDPTNQDHCDCEQLYTSSKCKGDVDLTHVTAVIEIGAERDGQLNSGDTEVEAKERRALHEQHS